MVCHKWITKKKKKLCAIRTQPKSGYESMRVRRTDCVFGEQSIGNGLSTNEERHREMEDSLRKKEKRQREEEGS